VASEAPGRGVVEEESVGDDACGPSVSMLQRAVAPRHGPVAEDAALRREDSQLRAYNLELRRRLENMTSFLAVRIADAQRKHRQWKDLLRPVPMALIASGLSGFFYWAVYFSHLRAFYVRRRKVERENSRGRLRPKPIPDWDEFTETMRAAFFMGISRWGVRALLSLFVLSITGASYLASRGYFDTLAGKVVPILYLCSVGALLLMVFVREAKRGCEQRFGPVAQALGQLSEFVEALGEDGPAAVQKIVIQQTSNALRG